MEPKNSSAIYIQENVKKDFDILKKWTNNIVKNQANFEKEMIDLLAYKINKMLDSDFNYLMEVMYKTDINEQKVKNVFGYDKSQTEVARAIAVLYLERMNQKWETKQAFHSDEKGDWND